jgi:ring-1,2-phenylacetyl-CoA epoxidase subunit PaaC
MNEALFHHTLALADDALVLGHRLSEWCRYAPTHEEDLALANMGLDLIGQARALYTYAAEMEGKGKTEDDYAYQRGENEFKNLLINELPNGDFAFTMVRMMLISAFLLPYWQQMKTGKEPHLAAIAERAEKEVAYHLRHASDWVIRLGDGTEESRARTLAALENLWAWLPEMFENSKAELELIKNGLTPDRPALRAQFNRTVDAILAKAALALPKTGKKYMQGGGRLSQHTEYLGYLLAEMQVLARRYPQAVW